MSKPIALYPYEVSNAIALELADFDDPGSDSAVDVRHFGANTALDFAETRTNGYDATSTSWQKLTFRLMAELPDEDLGRVLPATSSVSTDTAMVVQVACSSTKFRHGVRLRPVKTGVWAGEAVVQRDDVRGSVYFRPQLVRTTGILDSEDRPYATQAGAVIATGEPATLYVDITPPGVLQSTVSIAWEDFGNSDNPWRREHQDDVFHLEPFTTEPRLYLNSRYTQLREILDSDAKRGGHAVIRDTIAAVIAQPVMLQLATTALVGLEIDEDSQSVIPPSGWRSDLLGNLLPRLYPEEAAEEDRFRRAAQEIRESDGVASLLARLGSVVQEMLTSYKTVESAVRLYESSGEKEETSDG